MVLQEAEVPCPEVAEKPVRRRFTAEYKRKILAEAGALGELLRRGVENGTGPILASWVISSSPRACLAVPESRESGMLFHVLNRGIVRMQLFAKVGDYEAFDRVLADTLRQERVNQPENEKELEGLRRSVQRGRPYGTPAWQKKIAMRLGLESTLRPRGRPRARPAHKTQNNES